MCNICGEKCLYGSDAAAGSFRKDLHRLSLSPAWSKYFQEVQDLFSTCKFRVMNHLHNTAKEEITHLWVTQGFPLRGELFVSVPKGPLSDIDQSQWSTAIYLWLSWMPSKCLMLVFVSIWKPQSGKIKWSQETNLTSCGIFTPCPRRSKVAHKMPLKTPTAKTWQGFDVDL